jgi:uncharacterized protein
MFNLSRPLIIAVFATFFAAGLVKGVTGMGLPTVAMGVLGALISPLAAASLLIVPSFVTNVWQFAVGSNFGALLRRFWLMLIAVAMGTLLGSTRIASGDTSLTTPLLGVALITYSAYALLARQLRVPRHAERWLSPLIGAITGVVTGGTGVFVFPAVPYIQALGLSKDDLVQALGLSFTISTIALSVGLATYGVFHIDHLAMSVLAVIPALGGMWVGQLVRKRTSPVVFRRGFLICLLLLGGEMITRSLL